MKKLALAFLAGLSVASGLANAQNQPAGGPFAAVPIPGQPPAPAVPPPTLVPTPGVPRPPAPAAPGARPEDQLRIVADPATNSLIIFGTAQEFQNIKNILKELDVVPRQVLLDVLVAEVTLTDDQSLGFDYEILRKGGDVRIFDREFGSRGGVLTGVLGSLAAASSSGLTQFPGGVSGVIGTGKAVRALINALQSDSRVKILSAPTILATDNRPARIQVGSEEPIPTGTIAQAVGGVAQSTTIQYRNTGRIVTIIPQVNSQGLVNLQILAEVSQRGANVIIGNAADSFPSFDTRQAETTAVVQDGHTLAIGGIIAENKTRDRTGVPYLMDLPIIGRFFGSTSDSLRRTELVMLITPNVIRNRDESHIVTQDFKSKLLTLRNELEKMRIDREKDLEKLRRQAEEQKPAPQPPPAVEPPAPPVSAPSGPDPRLAPATGPISPAPSAPPQSAASQGAVPPVAGSISQPGSAVVSPPAVAPASPEPNFGALTAPSLPVSPMPQSAESKSTLPSAPVTRSQPETPIAPRVASIEAPKTEAPVRGRDKIGASLKESDITNSKPATPKKIAPSPTKPKQAWTVQVASFAQEKDAESLARKLTQKGYDVYIIPAEVGGKTLHRVQVGELTSRQKAIELQQTLMAAEKFDQAFIANR